MIQEFLCKTCNAVLDVGTVVGGTIKCPYCKNVYAIPKNETSAEAVEFLRIGEHELDNGEFDRAYSAFEKAAKSEPSEPNAYFGMALSTFKIRYIKDEVNNVRQPICYEIADKAFSSDKNYLTALKLSTREQRSVFERDARDVDYIRAEFSKLKDMGLDYDCFICTKVSDENGGYTTDSMHAMRIYNHLKSRGYAPFYSEEEIRGREGVAYEALILYALYMSECMLVICGNESYLQTPWVKNEYMRFISMIGDTENKDCDSITIVFDGKPIEKLPSKNAKIQGIDLKKPDAYSRIEDFVERHTPEAKKKRQEIAAAREREAEEIRKTIEEQKRAQLELEKRLKSITQPTAAAGLTVSVDNLLVRAHQELEDGNMNGARSYFNRALDIEPENAEAWFGMFVADMGVKSEDAIINKFRLADKHGILSNRFLKNAEKYASGETKRRVDDFKSRLRDKIARLEEAERNEKARLALLEEEQKREEERKKNAEAAARAEKKRRDAAAAQARAAEMKKWEDLRKRTEAKTYKKTLAFSIVAMSLSVILILTVVLSFAGVNPFFRFWTVWSLQVFGSRGGLALPIVLASLCFIGTLFCAIKYDNNPLSKGKRGFVLSIVLAVLVVCASAVSVSTGFVTSAMAENSSGRVYVADDYIIGFKEYDDGMYVKTFCASSDAVDIVIPSEIGGKTVVGILGKGGEGDPYGMSFMRSVTVPDTVSYIGAYAFYGSALKNAYLPSNGSWKAVTSYFMGQYSGYSIPTGDSEYVATLLRRVRNKGYADIVWRKF